MVRVTCEAGNQGWRCIVQVGDDPAAATHHVSIATDDLVTLAPPGTTAERLVEESFAFLLEREPRESILREFDLRVISRYFPEYDGEIRRRLGG